MFQLLCFSSFTCCIEIGSVEATKQCDMKCFLGQGREPILGELKFIGHRFVYRSMLFAAKSL